MKEAIAGPVLEGARNVLVRGPNWAGDVIMATPAFRALRAGFPAARLTLQLRPGLEPLLEGAPWFDAVVRVRSHGKGLVALWREARELRAERFDLGVCLPDSFASALLLRAGAVQRVVGYRTQGRGPLLHLAVDPPARTRGRRLVARERHVLGLVEALGCPGQGTHLELFVSEREEAARRRLFAERRLDETRPFAALAPGASYGASKLWPAERFARVGDALAEAGAQVAVVGAPGERRLAERLVAAMRRPAVDLTPHLDLGLLKAVLRRARVLVCNDAGARHVAVAFGVSCVVLFGPTSLAKTNLNLERVTALAADVACRPCYHRVCPIDHRCMTRLDPERVIAAALAALAGRGRS